MSVKAYAAYDAGSDLKPFEFKQREMKGGDVLIDITYCGVCHSDIHFAKGEWPGSIFPMVPGHEVIGKIVKIGSEVKKFKEGQNVGVGCFVNSCKSCYTCNNNEEQFCNDTIFTYNSVEKETGRPTYGGYSKQIIVNEDFVLKIGENLSKDLARSAPLLCAGITTYSPLKRWNIKKGEKVAVVGLGGLGHMAIKFAVAFGADVTVLSTSKSKEADANALGAHHFALTTDAKTMEGLAGSFDYILNTVSANIDYNIYLNLLKVGGDMTLVGIQPEPSKVMAASLVLKKRSISGSLIGGIKETQEMLDFCDKNNIFSDIELIKMEEINKAYSRMLKSDVKYRFVIDSSSF